MQKFGEKLYLTRKSKNISQEYLAEKLDVSRQTVSKWENGTANPNSENIKSLCEVLGVDNDYFYTNKPVVAEAVVTQCPAAVTEAAVAKVESPKPKRYLLGIVINALVLACLIAVTVCIGFISMPKNKGDFGTSTTYIDVSVFVILLIITCLSAISEVALTALFIRQKRKCKPNVN